MKTKRKKILSFFLCVILMVCVLPTPASADDAMEIRVSSAECLPGETVTVTIDLINNPGLASLKLKVVFDDALALQNIVYNTAMGGQTILPQTMASPATLMWISPFADYTSDVTFATLTFTVAQDATPNSVANISLTYDPNDIYDMTETNISCFVTNGKVNIGSINGDDEYIKATEHSKIDYINKIVFSDTWCETDITKIVNILNADSVEVTPNSASYIGTGSSIVIDKGNTTVTYSIVIAGDVNGDSACDVLDAALTNLAITQKAVLSDIAKCAATLLVNTEVELSDYQNVVNWFLAGGVTLNTKHTVTFTDYNGEVLKTENVAAGSWATPPENPTREGYEFTGWDKPIDNISGDTVITAEYALLNGPAFVVKHVNAQAGAEDIAVTISLANNPGIASIGMYVKYDSNLTLTGIEYNPDMGGQSVLPQNYSSPAKLTWVSPFENTTGNKIFATLYFNVSDTATGEFPIQITYNADDVYDMTENNIAFNVVNNAVLVTK